MSEPVVFEPERRQYVAGEPLRDRYHVDPSTVRVEVALSFRTESEVEEDRGTVSLTERGEPHGLVDLVLPRSPLSYDGELMRVVSEVVVTAFRPMGNHPSPSASRPK